MNGFFPILQNMSSLVERLRVRSDRKPIYQLDESDDDADFEQGKPGTTEEKFERIVRIDAVCFLILFCLWNPLISFFFFLVRYIKFFLHLLMLSFWTQRVKTCMSNWLIKYFQFFCVNYLPFSKLRHSFKSWVGNYIGYCIWIVLDDGPHEIKHLHGSYLGFEFIWNACFSPMLKA